MKILLVTTSPGSRSIDVSPGIIVEPLALEYVGAGVQGDHDVKLVDLRLESEPGLEESLETFQPDIIACGTYTIEVNSAKRICTRAKKLLPGILTVVGGHHATVSPGDFFEEYIDVVVKGEGPLTFKKICRHYEKKKGFDDIENIYFKSNGKWVFTFKKEHPPLDSLPFPARSLTAHVRHKYKTAYSPGSFASIRGSLGCVYRCTFCAVSGITGQKVYRRSIDRIIEELAAIEEMQIQWVDDEFLLDPKRAILIAKEIEKAGIKKFHNIVGRSDTIVRHPECIEALAGIGLNSVMVGFEAHREENLKKMNKNNTIAKNEEVVSILQQNQIMISGNFIIQQDFTVDDFKELAAYIRKLNINAPGLTVYTPLPGTPLYEEQKDNLIINDHDLFDLFHTLLPTRLPLKQFYKEYARCYMNMDLGNREDSPVKQLPQKELMTFLKMVFRQIKSVENCYRHYDEKYW